MVKDRNFTSHTYKAEIADQIGARVAQYYTVIKKYVKAFEKKQQRSFGAIVKNLKKIFQKQPVTITKE